MGIYEDLGVRPLIIIGRSDLMRPVLPMAHRMRQWVARVRPGAGSGRTQPGDDGGGDYGERTMTDSTPDPYTMPEGGTRESPTSFTARLKYLGPSIIISGSIVGSGEIILTSSLGAAEVLNPVGFPTIMVMFNERIRNYKGPVPAHGWWVRRRFRPLWPRLSRVSRCFRCLTASPGRAVGSWSWRVLDGRDIYAHPRREARPRVHLRYRSPLR